MRFNPILDQLSTYPTVALDKKKAQVRARGQELYDFGTGDPIEPTPDVVREAICDAIPLVSQYPTVRGPRALRDAIAGYCHRRFGVTLDPETQILPSSGSKEVCFHLPMLVIDRDAPDRTVVFPDPGYPPYHRGTLFAGGVPHIQVLSGDWKQKVWELPEAVLKRTRLVWINSPHNPSGAVLTRDELRRTWEVCRRHDILLASDECYVDVYDREPPPSILEVATEGVLAVHSLSKRSGMTGYRSGFVAGDPQWMALLRRFRVNPGLVPQDTINAGATAAWRDDLHPESRRDVLRAKKALFRAFFDDIGLEVVASEATFYFWLRTPRDRLGHPIGEHAYAAHLLEAGIVVSPGTYFGLSEAGRGYIRIAMVPDLATCERAIAAWRRVHEAAPWSS
ncbi:MAG: aminotransferase class I/II-fold pyridoxal phosphate-dependent enzyme [Myxococcota bacterium]|nr:aminotransferase class I/II-fold pyridoxal phosphate-dependent enzyme [Myxococcota bacterium]